MAILNFEVNVPDDRRDEILEGFVKHNGYSDTVPDAEGNPIPNPETREKAASRLVLERVKQGYKASRVLADVEAAKIKAQQEVDAIPITSELKP